MLTATKNSRTDSPERSRLFRFSARILIILGIFLVVWIYLGENGKKSSFVFQPNEIVEKSVVEVGEIIFKTGKTAKVENVYSAKEKRSISGNNLTLQGTVDGKIDLFLKPIIKSNSYELKIDLSEPIGCHENFIAQYPSVLREYFYIMPLTPLFDGQRWEISSCGGAFICSYMLSMSELANEVDISCSGKIKDSSVAVAGKMKINETFSGFLWTKMEIITENNSLMSIWNFYDKI